MKKARSSLLQEELENFDKEKEKKTRHVCNFSIVGPKHSS